MAHFSDSANGRIKAEAKHLTRVASLVLSDYPGGTRIHLMADADHRAGFTLAAAAINGELGRALAKLIRDHEDLQDITEGRYPEPDAGCIDCTVGTVPNDKNTGRCAYHLAKSLGIEAPKPAKVTA